MPSDEQYRQQAHDQHCEAEFDHGTMLWSECGCDQRKRDAAHQVQPGATTHRKADPPQTF